MALKKYNVTVNNMATVLQLDERGAKARGLTDKDLVSYAESAEAAAKAEAMEAKQAEIAAKAAEKAAAEADAKAAAAPANKSRTAANK